jgi:RNA polymerase sigma factor (TIGR02999 family)
MSTPEPVDAIGELTMLIDRMDHGDDQAHSEFCERVYEELRVVARGLRTKMHVDAMETTDVVQDLFGRWLQGARLSQMKNRRYFYAAAADQMRRMLIDHIRHRATQAAGGGHKQVNDPHLDALAESTSSQCGGDLEAMNAALEKLKADDARLYEVVRLKFFAGLTVEQIAESLGVSTDTVKRCWREARERLKRFLKTE